MALLEDTIGAVFEGGAATGLAIGAGVILLAPGLVPAIGKALRPLAKGAIKGGLYLYDQAAIMTQEAREAVQDIVAEARSELSKPPETAVPGRGRSPAGQAAKS